MICRNVTNGKDYEYTFEEGGKVRLRSRIQDFTILYEDWCINYFVIDKWRNLR